MWSSSTFPRCLTLYVLLRLCLGPPLTSTLQAQSELAGLALSRLMSDDGDLTDDERAELHAMLAPWSPSEASSWGGPGATPWLDD